MINYRTTTVKPRIAKDRTINPGEHVTIHEDDREVYVACIHAQQYLIRITPKENQTEGR